MINKVEGFTLSCDNCEEDYQSSSTDFSLWLLESDAIEHAKNDGWHETKSGKHFCPDCHEIGEDGSLCILPKNNANL